MTVAPVSSLKRGLMQQLFYGAFKGPARRIPLAGSCTSPGLYSWGSGQRDSDPSAETESQIRPTIGTTRAVEPVRRAIDSFYRGESPAMKPVLS